MQRCSATNSAPPYAGTRCRNRPAPGEDVCWQHGGTRRADELRERDRQAAERFRLMDRERRLRRSYERMHEKMGALERKKKIARWMLHEGGTEAFNAFLTGVAR